MLCLTAVTNLPAARDMPTAEAFVGRCFIAVMGGPTSMAAFYRDTLATHRAAVRARIEPFNPDDLPPDTHYDLA